MERGSIVKWLLFAAAIFMVIQFGLPLFGIGGQSKTERQPWDGPDFSFVESRAPEEMCTIEGPRFRAEVSSRGGSLRHFAVTNPSKYIDTKTGQPIDMVSTQVEERMPLRTNLRVPNAAEPAQAVPVDDLDFKLESQDGKSCTFTYVNGAQPPTNVEPDAKPAAPTVKVTKKVSASPRPFELQVDVTVENLSDAPQKHRFSVEQSAFRTQKDTEGKLGLESEFLTETVVAGAEIERKYPTDFEPDDFSEAITAEKPGFTPEKWWRTLGDARFVATSSSYFSSVLIPLEGPAAPHAETQIEERWVIAQFPNKSDDPSYGHVYRSRLAYPEQVVEPQKSVTYKALAYLGPKERDVLALVGGGSHGVSEVIDLGWFGAIGRILVQYIYFLHDRVGSWGWAICLLTITVKMALFPLSIAQIKSSVAMRKLKPEMDAINAKYKDDMGQRGLATQELWRKHGVASPVMGCIPVMLQMPVWFALYTALRTAVELYHTPFGPLIPDLAQPDKFYIIPIVLVISSFIQQKLMPPQGDPAQQKMMMYMMPAIFGVMMLFLPAGLGVYMLTNTWLGITQQVLVERYLKSRTNTPAGIEVREKKVAGGDAAKASDDENNASRTALESQPPLSSPPALGKGKSRVRG